VIHVWSLREEKRKRRSTGYKARKIRGSSFFVAVSFIKDFN